MQNGPHWRAAELHDLAAHAHRTAAVHMDKGDHETGHEHSKKAMEYSAKAYQIAQEAHQEYLEAMKEQKEKARRSGDGTSNSALPNRGGQSGKSAKRKK